MTTTASSSRRVAGERLSPFSLETLSHGRLQVPRAGLIHLQFRRFAGCPICSLHLRSFARGLPRLEAAGITSVAFFHSSAESLRPYHADLPFPVIPDPERNWYRAFGVESSLRSLLDPRAWGAAMRGMVRAPSNPLVGEGGHLGLPADFLVAPDGRLLDLHYGTHADDHWELDELLARAERALPPSSAAPSDLGAGRP